MISRLLEQKECVMRVLSLDRKSESLKLSWQSIDVLESVTKALQPLAPLTDALSGILFIHRIEAWGHPSQPIKELSLLL